MRIAAPAEFAKALRAIPVGTTSGRIGIKRYSATRSDFNNGRSIKLVSEALDGSDYISLNFYELGSGGQLAPCEMSPEKVIDFVMAYHPEPESMP